MKLICDPEKCTMCASCKAVCTQNCISDVYKNGQWFMQIDEAKCINCGLCEKTCPNIHIPDYYSQEHLVAAWACDNEIRKRSASGGIASSLYSYAIQHDQYICGVDLDEGFSARYQVTNDESKIMQFINSKYTYSDMLSCYEGILMLLKNGTGVLFVGLPCHCAGLLNYLNTKRCSREHLFIIDLVCHGTPHPDILVQHIHEIENRYGFRTCKLFFRDPKYGTCNYAFTMYGESIIATKNHSITDPQYMRYVIDNDVYQIGYHGAFIYRDCCYHCNYTRHDRVGDLTLFDSGGLGKIKPFKGMKENTSFVLINTKRGEELLNKAAEEGLISFENRPTAEAFDFNGQLNRPCKGINSSERRTLIELMEQGVSFDDAANTAFDHIIKKNVMKKALRIEQIKKAAKRIIPDSLIDRYFIWKYGRKRSTKEA